VCVGGGGGGRAHPGPKFVNKLYIGNGTCLDRGTSVAYKMTKSLTTRQKRSKLIISKANFVPEQYCLV
jgi:hypothetical protein